MASILRFGASKAMAFCSLACSSRSFSSTKRNLACGSTNLLINQGQATRSTLMSFLVIHFMFTSINHAWLSWNSSFETVNKNTDCTGSKDHERFWDLLCSEENSQR